MFHHWETCKWNGSSSELKSCMWKKCSDKNISKSIRPSFSIHEAEWWENHDRSKSTSIPMSFKSTVGAAMVELWCCSGGCCSGGAVGAAVVELRCCSDGVAMLQWWCCSGGAVVQWDNEPVPREHITFVFSYKIENAFNLQFQQIFYHTCYTLYILSTYEMLGFYIFELHYL